jgi:uncharacterized protein with von Willebrand factor type A (vWA) domain
MTTSSPIQPLRVWLRRGSLDRSLAAGEDPGASPELSRRARQLASRRCRCGLAASIRNLLDAAEERPRAFTAAVPIQRHAILGERQMMVQLAADLESDDELKPRGIALVERLLIDGGSPVYASSPDGALHGALVHAHAALYLD